MFIGLRHEIRHMSERLTTDEIERTRDRVTNVLRRARYAAMGAAVGAAIGGLFSRSAASTGGAIGGLIGAAVAETRWTVSSRLERVTERGD